MENEIHEDEIDLLSLIGILVKNKWKILIVTLIFMIGSIAFVIITREMDPETSPYPDYFRVESTVLLGSPSGNSGGVMGALSAAGLGSLAGLAGENQSASNSALIKLISQSNDFLDDMTRKLDLINYLDYPEGTPVKALRGYLKERMELEFDGSTNTMVISYESTDPVLAYNIVTEIVDVLADQMDGIEQVSQKQEEIKLEEKKKILEAEIARLEEDIINFQKTNNFLDANSIASVATSSATQARTELIKLESEINIMKQKVRTEDPQLQQLLTEQEIQNHFLDNLYTTGGYGIPPYSEIPTLVIDFTKLQTEYSMQNKVLASIVEQLELMKLTSDVSSSTFQVIENPERPEHISGPNRKKIVMIATVAGVFVGILFVFILEMINNIRKDEERMKKIKGIQE